MSQYKSNKSTSALCATLFIGAAALGGCASSPGGIEPAQVSASKYSRHSCASLRAKSRRVSKEALRVAGKVQQRSNNDAVATGVALVLFWPAAFFVKGDGPEAEQYAELVGERQAIEKAAKRKGCKIRFEPLKAANTDNPRRKKDHSPLEL